MSADNFWGNEENLDILDDKKLEIDPVNNIGYNQNSNIDEVVDEIDEPVKSSRVSDAIRRIEQAKLYESLLKHDFFAPGSANEDIQSLVMEEIREFILNRLEILVGIKQSTLVRQSTVVASPFSDSEIEALKSIAERLISKGTQTQPVAPKVRQFSQESSEPIVNKANVYNPVVNKTSQPVPPKKKISKKVIVDGQEFEMKGEYQKPAVSKTHPPKPMPPQSVVDQLNAAQVEKNMNGAGFVGNNSLLGLAVKSAQENNQEDK